MEKFFLLDYYENSFDFLLHHVVFISLQKIGMFHIWQCILS